MVVEKERSTEPTERLRDQTMVVKTRVFDLCSMEYRNLSELAHAMGISVSQVYRVREGKRGINQKFIVGALRAFPNYRLDDLFYLALGPIGASMDETDGARLKV